MADSDTEPSNEPFIALSADDYLIDPRPPSIRRDIEQWVSESARAADWRRREKAAGSRIDAHKQPSAITASDLIQARSDVTDRLYAMIDSVRNFAWSEEYTCPCKVGDEIEEEERYRYVPVEVVRGGKDGQKVVVVEERRTLQEDWVPPERFGEPCGEKITVYEESEWEDGYQHSWYLIAQGECPHAELLSNLEPSHPYWVEIYAKWHERQALRDLLEKAERAMVVW